MNTQKLKIPAFALLLVAGGALGGYASLAGAQTPTNTTAVKNTTLKRTLHMGSMGGMGEHGKKGHGVMGTVSAVNGNTITVTGKNGTSYTVQAGNATVKKMVTGSLSDVVIGDTIGVQGTVSGTTVTANTIMDDLPQPSVTIQ
jgi:hypothetical protein